MEDKQDHLLLLPLVEQEEVEVERVQQEALLLIVKTVVTVV
jgi:hypothetical protein